MPRSLTVASVVIALAASLCVAGERSTGKYSGVVIFDRWDGCTLYSGVYLMYVSEAVKEQLREQAGKCVQIDATQVEQPRNPGDGLIREFKFLGPAPEVQEWESPRGLRLSLDSSFENSRSPSFVIRVQNVTDKPVRLWLESLAPTLLAKRDKGGGDGRWSPSDGPSTAVVTRQSLWNGDGPRLKGGNDAWQWTVTKPDTLTREIVVPPGDTFEVSLSFVLPEGEYEFLVGYGGGTHAGQCIASNAADFDVDKNRHAVLARALHARPPTRPAN